MKMDFPKRARFDLTTTTSPTLRCKLCNDLIIGTSSFPHLINGTPTVPMKREQKIAMEIVLQIPLIVQKIFTCLQFRDLKSCRVLNSTWREISSKIIQERDCSAVFIRYDTGSKMFHRSSRNPSTYCCPCKLTKRLDLSSLTDLLQQSKDFPSSHFVFFKGNLGMSVPQKFFQAHGHQIKTLELLEISREEVDCSPFTSKDTFLEILLLHTGNIKNLTVQDLDYRWHKKDKIYLPSLNNFTEILTPLSTTGYSNPFMAPVLVDTMQTSGLILKSSPNLQFFNGLPWTDEALRNL